MHYSILCQVLKTFLHPCPVENTSQKCIWPQAYLQMEMDEQFKKFLTINTHKGLYQYKSLVFGISSAPVLWQRAMDQVLQGIPGTQCYLDDIIVTGKDDTDHLQILQRVLMRLCMEEPTNKNVSSLSVGFLTEVMR